MNELEKIVLDLYERDMIKFGQFVMKSGKTTDRYFDIRTVISYPDLLNRITLLMASRIREYTRHNQMNIPDRICGVSYAGIPLATSIASHTKIPNMFIRKERKSHGTSKLVEGMYRSGDRCILIDDVITTGSSLDENINVLQEHGLIVDVVLVFIDRRTKDVHNKFKVVAVITDEEIMNIIHKYVHVVQRRMRIIMAEKNTRLTVSADVTKSPWLLQLADTVGPHICALKTHCDIIDDWTDDTARSLRELALKHNFLIIEDRKFADIGNTVKDQLVTGKHKIATWADIVTVHGITGPGILDAIHEAAPEMGVLLLAQLSSANNLVDETYTLNIIQMADHHRNCVVGLICQQRLLDGMLHFTPGVHLKASKDSRDQQYRSPAQALGRDNCDIVIVGRGIHNSDDPAKSAIMYKESAQKNEVIDMKNLQAPKDKPLAKL